jgi:hypothetical protein
MEMGRGHGRSLFECSAMGYHRIGSTGGPDLVAQSGKVPGTMFEVLLWVLDDKTFTSMGSVSMVHSRVSLAYLGFAWLGCH